jgi:dihydrodipicolinate synthase/N-acetylneuraminate lyase
MGLGAGNREGRRSRSRAQNFRGHERSVQGSLLLSGFNGWISEMSELKPGDAGRLYSFAMQNESTARNSRRVSVVMVPTTPI